MSERREPKRSCRSAVPYTMIENELIARCRQGDREAQRQLYAKTSEHIYRLLLRMTGNSDDAFDLAQDTYVRAFAKIADFDGKSSVTTWLYRLAVNEALQCARRARKARTHLRALPVGNHDDLDSDRMSARLDVEEALAGMDPSDKALLLLRYQEGLNYRAIAEAANCPEGTVASRLNRARLKLRAILEEGYAQREETDVGGHQMGSGADTADACSDGEDRVTSS